MSIRMRSDFLCAAFSILLLVGCAEEESTGSVQVEDTPAALEDPKLAPNRLVEDPPERRPAP